MQCFDYNKHDTKYNKRCRNAWRIIKKLITFIIKMKHYEHYCRNTRYDHLEPHLPNVFSEPREDSCLANRMIIVLAERPYPVPEKNHNGHYRAKLYHFKIHIPKFR